MFHNLFLVCVSQEINYFNTDLLEGMWYLSKVASSREQLGLVSMFCPKYVKFCFQNLRNGREDENGRR